MTEICSGEMIPFNIPPVVGNEIKYVEKAISCREIGGDGQYTQMCSRWLERKLGSEKVFLTTSGTSALDMAMVLCDVHSGDEVILPSFTFSSTATAIISRLATPVFVDIRPDTMNIDETKIEAAITNRTKAIVVVHYAGVACEMDTILDIAATYHLKVVEDAAQAIFSKYRGRYLGTIGDFGCLSFHETKNLSMGEGGALLLRDSSYQERAEILREKGTDRTKFYRGEVDKYTWIDYGDSYLPSELNTAFLWGQLESAEIIQDHRLGVWNFYRESLKDGGLLFDGMYIPDGCEHNAHIFFLKLKNLEERNAYIRYMADKGIKAAFHYVPLHTSPGGRKYGRFVGTDDNTIKESERLVRLPLYYGMTESQRRLVVNHTLSFWKDEKNV